MHKNLKEYSRRFLSVLLCISIFCVFVVSPVSAADVDVILPLDDVLSLQENSNFWYYPNNSSYSVSFYYPASVNFVEGILVCSTIPTSISGLNSYNIIPLGDNVYRFYGSDRYATDSVNLTVAAASSISFINIISLKVSSLPIVSGDLGYTIQGYNDDTSGFFTSTVSPGEVYALNGITNSSDHLVTSFDFTLWVDHSSWHKYDYLFLRFDVRATSINSVFCRLGDYVLPSDLTLSATSFDIDSSNGIDNVYPGGVPNSHYGLSIDLGGLIRSSSDSIGISVTGTYPYGNAFPLSFGSIQYLVGYIEPEVIEADIFWYKKIWSSISNGFSNVGNWFTDIRGTILTNWGTFSTTFVTKMNELLDVFTGDSSEAEAAQQTQEEINVSINNQLVGAVEDWNTNIEVVETGYDMAFSKTTPALTWLASLADGIFNGMGWFGNVYFLVGLISVIMLVLSKSGLAHKIGSISRRKGD